MVLPTLYDDGGYSGGTHGAPCPATTPRRHRRRQVDVVVVYKVDRLTRSLLDFAKIVEVFDATGRLLRVGHPAVQHDHEHGTADPERPALLCPVRAGGDRRADRDKVAASKKKGMWMGGLPPLGYDVRRTGSWSSTRRRHKTVLHIFRRYVQLRSVRALQGQNLMPRGSGASGGRWRIS